MRDKENEDCIERETEKTEVGMDGSIGNNE